MTDALHQDLRTPEDRSALQTLFAMSRELRNLGWQDIASLPRITVTFMAISLESPGAFVTRRMPSGKFIRHYAEIDAWVDFHPVMWRQLPEAIQRFEEYKPIDGAANLPVPDCTLGELRAALKPITDQVWGLSHGGPWPDTVFSHEEGCRRPIIETTDAALARYVYMTQPCTIKRLLQRIDFLEGRLE